MKISSDSQLITEHILSWFETFKNERVQPDYGIPDVLGSAEYLENIKAAILSDLKNEFSDVLFNLELFFDDTGLVTINVKYKDLLFSNELNEFTVRINV